jgi:hypothetical protein
MVKVKYLMPLPNYGNEYRLSEDELVKLLDNAYANGFADAKDIYDERARQTTYATSRNNEEWRRVQEIGNR